MKETTLCYLIRDGRVLLAMKKRGFGEGKWNGPGGKRHDGESLEETCRRETLEEIGVTIGALEYRGMIRFLVEGKPEWNTDCTIFVSSDFSGDPTETEEMRPEWFALDAVPLGEMWEDDPIWLPGVLGGGSVNATFYFDIDGHVLRYEGIPS